MTPARLKAARLKLKLTQHEFGNRLDKTPRMVKYYESGAYPIPKTFEYAVYWLMVSERVKKVLLIKLFDNVK